MAMAFKTDQEKFWAGKFGDDYIERNQGDQLLASNLNMWVNMLKRCKNLKSCIEFGANIGMNLKALKLLHPDLELYGIEINSSAIVQAKKFGISISSNFKTLKNDFFDVIISNLLGVKRVKKGTERKESQIRGGFCRGGGNRSNEKYKGAEIERAGIKDRC